MTGRGTETSGGRPSGRVPQPNSRRDARDGGRISLMRVRPRRRGLRVAVVIERRGLGAACLEQQDEDHDRHQAPKHELEEVLIITEKLAQAVSLRGAGRLKVDVFHRRSRPCHDRGFSVEIGTALCCVQSS